LRRERWWWWKRKVGEGREIWRWKRVVEVGVGGFGLGGGEDRRGGVFWR